MPSCGPFGSVSVAASAPCCCSGLVSACFAVAAHVGPSASSSGIAMFSLLGSRFRSKISIGPIDILHGGGSDGSCGFEPVTGLEGLEGSFLHPTGWDGCPHPHGPQKDRRWTAKAPTGDRRRHGRGPRMDRFQKGKRPYGQVVFDRMRVCWPRLADVCPPPLATHTFIWTSP